MPYRYSILITQPRMVVFMNGIRNYSIYINIYIYKSKSCTVQVLLFRCDGYSSTGWCRPRRCVEPQCHDVSASRSHVPKQSSRDLDREPVREPQRWDGDLGRCVGDDRASRRLGLRPALAHIRQAATCRPAFRTASVGTAAAWP